MRALTSHSQCPWKPSWLSFLTAMTMPVPGLAGAKVVSSTPPLNTDPKPPSPSTLSGRKFRVAVRSSVKAKLFTLADCRISPSLLGVARRGAGDLEGRWTPVAAQDVREVLEPGGAEDVRERGRGGRLQPCRIPPAGGRKQGGWEVDQEAGEVDRDWGDPAARMVGNQRRRLVEAWGCACGALAGGEEGRAGVGQGCAAVGGEEGW